MPSVQSIPLSMLEPEDIEGGSRSSGPLGAAIAQNGPLGSGQVASMSPSGIVNRQQGSMMTTAGGDGMHSAGAAIQSNSRRSSGRASSVASEPQQKDALMTWIGGQLSIEEERKQQEHSSHPNTRTSSKRSSPARMVDFSAFEIDFNSLQMGKRIGEGSFGKVYLAKWNETPVAVKVLVDEVTALDHHAGALKDFAAPVLQKLQEEAGLMASLRHPNVVSFLGFCQLPPCVITEYCSRGSLADVLRAAKQNKPGAAHDLTWQRRLSVAADAATGMLHLHAKNPPIIHRDLKSANILVDAHWRAKVADFNLSRIVEESTGSSSLAAM